MRNRGRSTGAAKAWAAAALIAALATAARAQEDTVVLKSGKSQTLRITDSTLEGVAFSVEGGGSSLHKWDQIQSVKLGGAPELYKGIDLVGAGKADEATAILTKLAENDKTRGPVRQEAMFHLALARQRAGDADGAVKAYRDLLGAFPKGRYLSAAGANLLSALLAKRDVDGAAKTLDDVSAAAKAAGARDAVMASLSALRGQVLEAQGKYPDALSAYEKIAGASTTERGSALAARLGAARCLAATGKAEEAERRFKDLVKEDAPNGVLSGAWNGLGDLWLAAGSKARDSEKVRDALLAYLRGVVLYVPGADEPSDERERALAGSARAFRAVAELESSADAKKLFLERSRQRREQLKAQFPGSRYIESD